MSEYDLDWLRSDALASVKAEEYRWIFDFLSGGSLIVQCPWRILEGEAIRDAMLTVSG